MSELEQLHRQYYELLEERQSIQPALDYSVLDGHIRFLNYLSEVGNSGITVFDLYKKEHVYTSTNYATLFGYSLEQIEAEGNSYFDSKIHPDDYLCLTRNGLTMLKFYFDLPREARKDYKMITEYRILNQESRYIRVIEQHQSLELDINGNPWLSLGVMDVAPNQDSTLSFKSQIINFRNGEIVLPLEPEKKPEKQILSERELAILHLMKDGFLSKEISGLLSISVHTVNTHRQRILEKLNASNTIEAINYAKGLGLV